MLHVKNVYIWYRMWSSKIKRRFCSNVSRYYRNVCIRKRSTMYRATRLVDGGPCNSIVEWASCLRDRRQLCFIRKSEFKMSAWMFEPKMFRANLKSTSNTHQKERYYCQMRRCRAKCNVVRFSWVFGIPWKLYRVWAMAADTCRRPSTRTLTYICKSWAR